MKRSRAELIGNSLCWEAVVVTVVVAAAAAGAAGVA